jgi:hypothetical protein
MRHDQARKNSPKAKVWRQDQGAAPVSSSPEMSRERLCAALRSPSSATSLSPLNKKSPKTQEFSIDLSKNAFSPKSTEQPKTVGFTDLSPVTSPAKMFIGRAKLLEFASPSSAPISGDDDGKNTSRISGAEVPSKLLPEKRKTSKRGILIKKLKRLSGKAVKRLWTLVFSCCCCCCGQDADDDPSEGHGSKGHFYGNRHPQPVSPLKGNLLVHSPRKRRLKGPRTFSSSMPGSKKTLSDRDHGPGIVSPTFPRIGDGLSSGDWRVSLDGSTPPRATSCDAPSPSPSSEENTDTHAHPSGPSAQQSGAVTPGRAVRRDQTPAPPTPSRHPWSVSQEDKEVARSSSPDNSPDSRTVCRSLSFKKDDDDGFKSPEGGLGNHEKDKWPLEHQEDNYFSPSTNGLMDFDLPLEQVVFTVHMSDSEEASEQDTPSQVATPAQTITPSLPSGSSLEARYASPEGEASSQAVTPPRLPSASRIEARDASSFGDAPGQTITSEGRERRASEDSGFEGSPPLMPRDGHGQDEQIWDRDEHGNGLLSPLPLFSNAEYTARRRNTSPPSSPLQPYLSNRNRGPSSSPPQDHALNSDPGEGAQASRHLLKDAPFNAEGVSPENVTSLHWDAGGRGMGVLTDTDEDRWPGADPGTPSGARPEASFLLSDPQPEDQNVETTPDLSLSISNVSPSATLESMAPSEPFPVAPASSETFPVDDLPAAQEPHCSGTHSNEVDSDHGTIAALTQNRPSALSSPRVIYTGLLPEAHNQVHNAQQSGTETLSTETNARPAFSEPISLAPVSFRRSSIQVQDRDIAAHHDNVHNLTSAQNMGGTQNTFAPLLDIGVSSNILGKGVDGYGDTNHNYNIERPDATHHMVVSQRIHLTKSLRAAIRTRQALGPLNNRQRGLLLSRQSTSRALNESSDLEGTFLGKIVHQRNRYGLTAISRSDRFQPLLAALTNLPPKHSLLGKRALLRSWHNILVPKGNRFGNAVFWTDRKSMWSAQATRHKSYVQEPKGLKTQAEKAHHLTTFSNSSNVQKNGGPMYQTRLINTLETGSTPDRARGSIAVKTVSFPIALWNDLWSVLSSFWKIVVSYFA